MAFSSCAASTGRSSRGSWPRATPPPSGGGDPAAGAEPAPAQAPAPGFAPRRLRTLIDAITRKGGGGLQGQLLVYRVFLRVPPAVMFSAGIKSLSLVDDSLELSDATPYEMIRNAARTVASIDLDEAIS